MFNINLFNASHSTVMYPISNSNQVSVSEKINNEEIEETETELESIETKFEIEENETELESIDLEIHNPQKKSPQKKEKIHLKNEAHTFIAQELDKIKENKYPNIKSIAKELHPLIQQEFGNSLALHTLQCHFSTNNKKKCKNKTDNCAQKVALLIDKQNWKEKKFIWTEEVHQFVATELDKIKGEEYQNISSLAKKLLPLIQDNFGNTPHINNLTAHLSINHKMKCKKKTDNCAQKVVELVRKTNMKNNKKKPFKWTEEVHQFMTAELNKIKKGTYQDLLSITKKIRLLLQKKFADAPHINTLRAHLSINHKMKCKKKTDNCAQKVAELTDTKSKTKIPFRWTEEVHQFVSAELDKIKEEKYPDLKSVVDKIHLLIQQKFTYAPHINSLYYHFSTGNIYKCKSKSDNCAHKVAGLID